MTNKDFETEEVTDNEKAQKWSMKSIALVTIGVICICISVFQLIRIFSEYKRDADNYENLESEFVQVYKPTEVESESESESIFVETESEVVVIPQIPWYEMLSVDLAGLQEKYPDVVGWLYFENEDISYPIMQGEELETYLRLSYDGKKSMAGSIFIDSDSAADFSDTQTFIYGHNMKNLSMFGKLKYYRTKSGYYEEHKYVQIFSGNEILRYQIFAYQEVPLTHAIYQDAPHTSAKNVADMLAATSMIDTDLTITDEDKIVTFSTCTSDKEHRFIVSAVLVERHTIAENIENVE